MTIKWNKTLATGYEEIDNDHKELVHDAKVVFQAIKTKNFENINVALDGFLHNIKDHFASEEKIMEEVKLPELDGHRKLHEKFILATEEVINSYNKERSSTQLKKDFNGLSNAMVKHIVNYDQPAFIKIKKLQEASLKTV